MSRVVDWLGDVPGHQVAPLFDADEALVVRTKNVGRGRRRTLRRSAAVEEAIITTVEQGLTDPAWEGVLYVMGKGRWPAFRPLYVGKAERKGVKNELSANVAAIRTNTHKFARWGDGLDYHIGDLSHALFGFDAYRTSARKYQRWAAALFRSYDPPQLREMVCLYIAPWHMGDAGPSGRVASLAAVEKHVIALASIDHADELLNVDGA